MSKPNSPVSGKRRLRPRWRSGALVALALVLAGLGARVPAMAEVMMAITAAGEVRYLDPDQDPVLLTEVFRPRLDGKSLFSSRVGGAARLDDGRIVLALLPKDLAVDGDLQQGWGLYEFDPNARELELVTPLAGALSAISIGPGNELFGVTWDPAKLVRIDLATGAFTDLGAFLLDQSSVPLHRFGYAALWFEPDRSRFVHAYSNVATYDLVIAAVAVDGSDVEQLGTDLPTHFQVYDAVVAGDDVLVLDYNEFHLLRSSKDSVRRAVTSAGPVPVPYSRATRRLPFGETSFFTAQALVSIEDRLDCVPSSTVLCLRNGDYRVTATWVDPFTDDVKAAGFEQQSADSGSMWFLEPSNQEGLVKVLSSCGLNGHAWVFGAASTTLGYTIRVEEIASGEVREYSSPGGVAAPAINDTAAFPCS